jgi:KDO2-lipid IV(A) lauroyltransferase
VKTSRVVATYKAAAALCRVAPSAVTSRVAFPIGVAAAAWQHEPRKIAERNLRRVLGEGLHGRELRRLSREVFVSYARYYVDSFRLPSRSADEIERGFTVDGYDHVEAALAGETGPILALPHLGGWEWAAFWLTRIKGERVSAVVEELRPPELFEWFTGLRRELGMDVIPLGAGAGAAVVKAIKDRHITCLLTDRYLSGGGVPVEFFGERTMLPAGPATLALRTGAPLLPTAVYFRRGGVHGVVRPPVPVHREGKLRDDVARVTQLMARELEGLIAVAPEQWHLLQPNWPIDYTALGRAVPERFDELRAQGATAGTSAEGATESTA